ncbi:polymorphic toxin-type HINT domain-containing protein [Streptomyces sp. NPDC049881]|uniref:polymorphic toxin-type HINT domain-containing protein n=1 Tax=Streptomyces sp. NPDC049881 TaxID=3155778 RepID=UPI0034120E74
MNGTTRLARALATLRRRVAWWLALVMVASLLQALSIPAVLAATADSPDLPAAEEPVGGRDGLEAVPRRVEDTPRIPQEDPRNEWPEPAEADIPVENAPAVGRASSTADAGGPPVRLSLTDPSSARSRSQDLTARVRVLGQETSADLGVRGVVLTVEPTARTATGTVDAELDYAGFAGAYGGGFGSRLTFYRLPSCALDTPAEPACRTATPIPASNDTERSALTAEGLELAAGNPVVLAAAADDQGVESDYTATELSPSSTWDVSLNTGDFGWSYDMPVPDVPGGLTPTVGLSYSSGAIDGQTGGTNNQASWAGDGFDLWPGYIERHYQPCADEGVENTDGNKVGDLCWDYDNAFISFNGAGGELVPAGEKEWKFQQDDGTRVRQLTSADRANGDNDNEYWELTTPDGTRYYFGYHRLPGWTSGRETTDSTWTVPVFGNDSGEPCHAATAAASHCTQAWRWNLDYVEDVRGNAVAYYYDTESNSYGRFLDRTANSRYIRGGTLDRIEYGLDSDTVYTAPALAKVDFTGTTRCLPQVGVDCTAGAIDDNEPYWYDTPWDLNCGTTEDCDAGRYSPTFWTRNRLTGVTTQVLNGGSYANIDSWALTHRWGSADVDYQLLLDSVQRTGHTATPAITLPRTSLVYTQRANRLDRVGDGYAPFIKERLSSIADEYGGQIDVEYSGEACDAGSLPTPETNTTRCFPQFIGGGGDEAPDLEWFNKYVVTAVTATDRTGGSPDQVTRYQYLGGAAWHFADDNGLVPDDEKTWSQWRGYGHVRVLSGSADSDGMVSQDDSFFLRGMDGDRRSEAGGTKEVSVSLPAGEGDPITDHPSAQGFLYRTATYDRAGGRVLERTVTRPWHHETARSVRDWGTITANFTGDARTSAWTSLDDGAGDRWRATRVDYTYDTVAGRLTQTNELADTSTSTDDRCVRVTYADNPGRNILTLQGRSETVTVSCTATPDRETDVLTDTRWAYDGGGYGQAPTVGDITATAVLKEHDGTTATYLESGATYDGYGRVLSSTDLTATVTATGSSVTRAARGDGRTSTSAYSPATGFATRTTDTTPRANPAVATSTQVTVTTLDPLRGQPTDIQDTNDRHTLTAYDALGRTTKIWLANRVSSQLPNYQFTYRITDGQPVAIGTRTLDFDGTQISAYTLLDGFLRPRQTQGPGPSGYRLLTDTFYDERGLVTQTYATYPATGTPQETVFLPEETDQIETQSRQRYDGRGRATEVREVAGSGDGGRVLSTTTISYLGDRTTVIPPDGATATTTLFDARGQTTELRQHHQRSATAAYDTTRYAYTRDGQLAEVTDPAGNRWTYTYDQLGRTVATTDPDAGRTVSAYDDRGQLTTRTNERDITLAYRYDGLGRATELREGSATGPLRAAWTYDTVSRAEGELARSVRYDGDAAYVSEVTVYDQLYRPTRSQVTIPAVEDELAGTYLTTTQYDTSGTVRSVNYGPAAGQPSTTYTFAYEEDTMRPITMSGGTRGVNVTTGYTLTGKPQQYVLSHNGGDQVTVANTFEWGTQRLATVQARRGNQPGWDRGETYTYDQAGNVLSVADLSRTGTDVQCFQYDYLRRITEAWAQGVEDCAETPSTSVTGGPAPYWHSYTYDAVGNRLSETRHEQDTARTYDYPDPGSPQPHTVTSVVDDAPGVRSLEEYTYDETGNTLTRQIGGDTQELTWDAEGHLASVEEADGSTTEYLYDADGSRLIGRTPTETTLYLGHTEITLPGGTDTPQATRYIDLGGGHMAVIAPDQSVTFTLADHHGTGQIAVDAVSMAVDQRRTLPFGDIRGDTPDAWPGTRGFVGGTTDSSTGLTHLGAREYDPALGRFISLDPVMDLSDPQQLHGYTYANNNPLAYSDPSGLKFIPKVPGPNLGKWLAGRKAAAKRKQAGGGFRGGSATTGKLGRMPAVSTATPAVAASATSGRVQGIGWNMGIGIPDWLEDAGEWLWDANETVFDFVMPDVRGAYECIRERDASLDCIGSIADLTPLKINKGKKLLDKLFGGAEAADDARDANRAVPNDEPEPQGNGPGCSTPNSFLPGTQVLMADGSAKPIEDVRIGDKVLAADPATGETTARTVTAEIGSTGEKNLVAITIETDDGEQVTTTLTATAAHPFWVPALGTWVDATDLTVGAQLETSNGTTAEITTLTRSTTSTTVHNLTIEGLHTYYVIAGQTPVLVHNQNTPCSPGVTGGSNVPSRIAGPNGEDLPGVPEGAVGTVANNGNGMRYAIPPGAEGLDPRVAEIRVMNPVSGGRYEYPNGYVVYHNASGQKVNPLTGQTIGNSDPYAHIPIPAT